VPELSGLTRTRVSKALEEFPTRERMGKSIINLNSCMGARHCSNDVVFGDASWCC
jgi:hypothetical protein